jgi:hypothetical protein
METAVPSEVLVPLIAEQNTRRHIPQFNQPKEIIWKYVGWIHLAQWRLVVRKAVKFRPHTNIAVSWLANRLSVLTDSCLCS